MEELEKLITKLKEIHEEILDSPKYEPTVIENLNLVNDQFTTLSRKTRKDIISIVEDGHQTTDLTSAQLRIIQNQRDFLRRRFTDILVGFNTEQLRYREECKNNIKQYLTSGK